MPALAGRRRPGTVLGFLRPDGSRWIRADIRKGHSRSTFTQKVAKTRQTTGSHRALWSESLPSRADARSDGSARAESCRVRAPEPQIVIVPLDATGRTMGGRAAVDEIELRR